MKVDNVDTLKGNIMIADFMGWVHHKDSDYDATEMANLKYHSSWDWIMQVVAKIEGLTALNRFDIYYKNCKIEYGDEDVYYEVESGIQGDTKIHAVWLAIVYFIDWVNTEGVDLENPVFYD